MENENTKKSRTRRERMKDAGLKEIRGLVYPADKHEDIKKEVRRKHGRIKVK